MFSEEGKDKRQKEAPERFQNFTEEEREKRCQHHQGHTQNLPEYRGNYYLTHKKYLATLKIQKQLNLPHRLALEMWKNF